MSPRKHILLFPQEHVDLVGAMHELSLCSRTRPRLSAFFNGAAVIVRKEAANMHSPRRRSSIDEFEDFVHLAERHVGEGRQGVIPEMVLLTIVQVGQLLLFFEDNASIMSSTARDVSIPVGFGFGLIAAAVASAANDLDDVAALGAESVAVSFRLAAALQQIGEDLEDSDGIWARTISGIDMKVLEQQLESVNGALLPLRRVYIGQVLPQSVVLFGPPSSLDLFARLINSPRAVASPTLPIKCPMHGQHYPPVNAVEIVGVSSLFDGRKIQRLVFSAHSPAASISAETLGKLLQRVVVDVGHKPMLVKETLRTVTTVLKEMDADEANITTFGSSWDEVQHILQEALPSAYVENPRLSLDPPVYDINNAPKDAIAIVGMSGRFPEGDNLEEFWRLLEAGATTHREIPPSRFRVEEWYDPSCRMHNPLLTRFGCFIKKPGEFDHRLFNISPREALQMDPVQRMFLMTTYEALEMAGYGQDNLDTSASINPRIATYFGQTTDDWKTINEQQGIDTHFLPGVNRSFAPGRLGHYFRWTGGFYSIDTGCSSSATALCLARQALAAGECDAAVVGGGTLLSTPEWFSGLSQGGFLSPTGACKTFSADADGYCRGEGVAVVVLKRLSDAVRSRDNILAVIAGAARNGNGGGAGSITHPSQQAQATIYRRTLRQAGIRPQDVSVVEMHGTGTQAGDRVELHALHDVFASTSEPRRRQPLIVSAVKASIGHSEAAAGIMSLIKAVLMLQHNHIPPQPGQPFALNPHIAPFLGKDFCLANGQDWPHNGVAPRYILVNSFDAAGGNVSLVLHDKQSVAPPPRALSIPLPLADSRSHHIIVVSSHTVASHKANKSRLHQFLTEHPDTELADLAYTTTARRMHHHAHREAFVVKSPSELLHQLQKSTIPHKPVVVATSASVVFVFTGQGSQYMGMGYALYRSSPSFKRLVDSYQDLCDAQRLDCQFIDIIRTSPETNDFDATTNATSEPERERELQVATVALEIALARYWQSLGIRPTLVIGHSLGEYAALCIAGVMSVSDTLALACDRARHILTRCPPSQTGMLAVGLSASTVSQYLLKTAAKSKCEVTCHNSPSSTVIGGPIETIKALENDFLSHRDPPVTTTRLRVQHAFHTSHVDPALDHLESSASLVSFHPPAIAIASTLLGQVVRPGDDTVFNAKYLRRHTREAVAFLEAVRACEAEELIHDQSLIIEIGPHPTCLGLITSSLQTAKPSGQHTLRRGHDVWRTISQCLATAYCARLPIDWTKFHKDYLCQPRLLSSLPSYAFDSTEFWLPYLNGAAKGKTPDATKSSLSTTCLHSIEQLRKESNQLLATFNVNLSAPELAKLSRGHVVDGRAIAPASLFIEIAYTVSVFLDRENQTLPDEPLATYEMANLAMQTPLVLGEDDTQPQFITVEATLDQLTDIVSLSFLSHKDKAKPPPVKYGYCSINLKQPVDFVTQGWSRMQPLIKSRMHCLNASLRPTEVYTVDKRLFYNIFSNIVDYSVQYQAVEEATIATNFGDAAVILRPVFDGELRTFTCSPFSVDAFIHIAGFLLNADTQKPKDDIYIANHIGSLRVLGSISTPMLLQAYATVRDKDMKLGISVCDVYITDGQNKLVAMCTDITFKKLKRDFFAFLTGAARSVLPQTRQSTTSGFQWQQGEVADSGTTSAVTATSVSPVSSSTSSSAAPNISAELLVIVATATGISLAELKSSPGRTFAEMGVDSQMSIAILAEFLKVTTIELPAAFFTNFPTVAAIEKEMGEIPPLSDNDHEGSHRSSNNKEIAGTSTLLASGKALFQLVADTLGLQADDLTSSTSFESIGLDSMLSIKIASAFQQKTQVELPAAFFTDHRTIGAAKQALDGLLELTSYGSISKAASPEQKQDQRRIIPPAIASVASPRQAKLDSAIARAVLIQGQSRSGAAPLFMITDGSGTVESYIHLRALPHARRLYALESPFVEHPEEFDLSVEELATVFLKTIRRIQPHGPYLIGGWSAGSILAYEIAHRLSLEDETIEALVILDMRAPTLIPTSIITTDFLNKLGTFEGINRARNLPEDLSIREKAHLLATCRAIAQYEAPPFPSNRMPKHVAVVWARLGLDDREDAPVAAMSREGWDVSKMTLPEFEQYFNSWFYGRREHFGTNGWETLLGNNISVHTVDGNHFSMMSPPFSDAVGTIVINTITPVVEKESV